MKTTHVVLVLDRSGSMHNIREQAVNNYNDQIRGFKKISEEVKDGELKVSLISFNSDVYEHLWAVPANEVKECAQGDYIADGWTAMLDAMGYGIEKLMQTTDCENPDNVYMMIVISDGEENSSKHYNNGKLFEMIDSKQRSGRWTFTFMGCSEQNIRQTVVDLGIPIANCAVWDSASKSTASRAYKASVQRTNNAVRGLATGQCCSYNTAYSDVADECADFASPDLTYLAMKKATFMADPVPSVVNPAVVNENVTAVFSSGNKVVNWKC